MTIPLDPVPSQSFQIVLDNQDCEIDLLFRGNNFFVNLIVDGTIVQQGAIVHDAVSIITRPNNIFSGAIAVIDTQGDDDPLYSGLGTRWQMVYFSTDDLLSM